MNNQNTPELLLIIENLKTQDNRATYIPIFVVQQKKRDYGYDPNYSDYHVWLDEECREADAEESSKLDKEYNRTYKEPEGWTRTSYVDRWEFVTACFTEQGCKDYLELNGHNLKETRIYVESGRRNKEWEIVRNRLLSESPSPREKRLEEALRKCADALESSLWHCDSDNEKEAVLLAARAALEDEG